MIIAVRGVATCTPVRTCVLGKECEFITSVNVDFYKEPGMRLVTKREVKTCTSHSCSFSNIYPGAKKNGVDIRGFGGRPPPRYTTRQPEEVYLNFIYLTFTSFTLFLILVISLKREN